MKCVSVSVSVLLWVLWSQTHGVHIRLQNQNCSDGVDAAVLADLSAVIHRVDRRFLSVTIDASLASEEKFMYLLSSPKIRTLAGALSPAFVRFGGTRQDFMVFVPRRPGPGSGEAAEPSCAELDLPSWLEEKLKADWTQQKLILLREDLQRKYRRVKFTEPNSYEKKAGIRVDGYQLGQDFTRLREMMSESKLYRDAGLFGPDVGQPRDHRVDILEGFLQTGSGAVDACTWHHYYVNGRDTSLEDFLDPEVLDTLALKTGEVLQKVQLASPGKPVWLGETSSAYGGGAVGLSDTFVAGFMWLDKLGLAARLGLDVVMRQVFIGSGSYHLVDDNLDPLPDYWLSVLYKRLVGPEVLKVEASPSVARSKRVRLYLHCANRNRYGSGAVTLMAMNLSKKPARISIHALVSSGTVEAFVLESEQPGEDGLYSRSVRLNGVVLKMLDDKTLPDLNGLRLPPSEHLQLPAYSLAFFVLTDARAAGCE
ncbi:heparanase-like isoform X3 [Sparus aurata]|uniref:heparanase-like isoform X3 n=1 Tax=Sparus aurata TaxID=8175 RepID=UPI0011C0FDFA|nr:heparanase-like isoform X3 [Sparus aurata]